MTIAQRRTSLPTHFSERILVVERRMSVCGNHVYGGGQFPVQMLPGLFPEEKSGRGVILTIHPI